MNKGKLTLVPLSAEQQIALKIGDEVFWVNKSSDPEETRADEWVIEQIDHNSGTCTVRWDIPDCGNGDKYFNENALIADLLLKAKDVACGQEIIDELTAREESFCRGCGCGKEAAPSYPVLCWSCWKGEGLPFKPFKYFRGTFEEWLTHVKEKTGKVFTSRAH